MLVCRYDVETLREVPLREVTSLEDEYNMPVFKVDTINGDFSQVAWILNIICETLWVKDQQQFIAEAATLL